VPEASRGKWSCQLAGGQLRSSEDSAAEVTEGGRIILRVLPTLHWDHAARVALAALKPLAAAWKIFRPTSHNTPANVLLATFVITLVNEPPSLNVAEMIISPAVRDTPRDNVRWVSRNLDARVDRMRSRAWPGWTRPQAGDSKAFRSIRAPRAVVGKQFRRGNGLRQLVEIHEPGWHLGCPIGRSRDRVRCS